ncbi:MAG: LL-diaminopimelate aminotransferase [Thermodesulfobacteriota bacterium]|nr:LL-diaminopimelate aminotransferase [Thermodesulfobacteriota bacterium]
MITINENFLKLQASYLFSEIATRVSAFQKETPDTRIIKLGIGDATQPLCNACIEAFHKAVDEMGEAKSFRGYGPEQGYPFLREAIAKYDYQSRGADISAEEIFISDGAKCDTGNFQEILATDIRVAIPDPVYPVYLDTNVMAGRTGMFQEGRYEGVVYMECTADNNFLPALPDAPVDLIYLCFPNNPTGVTATHAELKKWVDFAIENKALILYDAAYEAFIRDDATPRTIYEVAGAEKVAVEFRSFSKTAGFTGTRCAFTVVPKACAAYDSAGNLQPLHSLWNRRHSTKFNGVSYPVQRAAEAVYSPEGRQQTRAMVEAYMKNADRITGAMGELGFSYVGGEHSPYVWVDAKIDSWELFDILLKKAGVVCTPGAGFGKCGAQYIRLSAFNTYENVDEAMTRIQDALKS